MGNKANSAASAVPKFITIEGIEGVGKSTAVKALSSRIRAAGLNVRVTREPGGTKLGESIRALLLGHGGAEHGICANAELLMLYAARAQHLAEVIAPALGRGEIVICDRFIDSSYAYQGAARGVSSGTIDQLNRAFVDLMPQSTILLDAPVSVGRDRANRRSSNVDRIEAEQDSFFEKARQRFLQRAVTEPDRFHVVDASRDQPAVEQALRAIVNRWLDVGTANGRNRHQRARG